MIDLFLRFAIKQPLPFRHLLTTQSVLLVFFSVVLAIAFCSGDLMMEFPKRCAFL